VSMIERRKSEKARAVKKISIGAGPARFFQ
jgi:hypothetical protein